MNIFSLPKEEWDRYTGLEEYEGKKDKHERFLGSYSKYNPLTPSVSKIFYENNKIEYPGKAEFAICFTHDVDDIYPPLSHKILNCYNKIFEYRKTNTNNLFLHKKEYVNFKRIMDLEEKYGACSSFYFMSATQDIRRFRYNIEDISNEIGQINDRGWEVGLHGGYYSYNNIILIKKEKKRIEKIINKRIVGCRNHYLRFRTPDTWELLSKADFEYDTTYGYSDMAGFRNGMCHPFKPYNIRENKYIEIYELPLILMDSTINRIFLNRVSDEQYVKLITLLIKKIRQVHGVFTVLFHNDMFSPPFNNYYLKLYTHILKIGQKNNAYMTNGSSLIDYYKKYL